VAWREVAGELELTARVAVDQGAPLPICPLCHCVTSQHRFTEQSESERSGLVSTSTRLSLFGDA
jgi:hypothetical protein